MTINRFQIALVLLAGVFIAILFWRNNKLEKQNEFLEKGQWTNNKIIADLAGQNQTLVLEKDALQEYYQNVLDSLDDRRSRVEEGVHVQTRAGYDIQSELVADTVKTVDTVYVRQKFGYTSPYIDLTGSLSNDLLDFDITVYDSLTLLKTSEFRWFKPRKHTVTAYSHNPHVKILGVNSLTYKERPRRISLGPFIGVNLAGKVVIGLGVQYSIIRF